MMSGDTQGGGETSFKASALSLFIIVSSAFLAKKTAKDVFEKMNHSTTQTTAPKHTSNF